MRYSQYKELPYRDDIQGLRAFSAVLIMTYHIWVNKVSGGVDVFLVIAGYLMASVIVKRLANGSTVGPVKGVVVYLSKSIPTAIVVLVVSFFVSLLFVPPPLWKYAGNELIATVLQVLNFELIRMQADYFAREQPPSFMQHYWALSIIVQLFAVCYFLVWAPLKYLNDRLGIRLVVLLILVFLVLSFLYSIVSTNNNPGAAYFNTAARAWQFLFGALIAIVLPVLKERFFVENEDKKTNIIMALTMLSALICFSLFGLIHDKEHQFPGYISLFPVMFAVIIISAGYLSQAAYNISPLRWRPLVYLGRFSFTIYLWHWPVMVFTQWYFQLNEFGLIHGVVIISISIFLAWATTRIFDRYVDGTNKLKKPFVRLVVFSSVALCLFVFFRQGLIFVSDEIYKADTGGRSEEGSFLLGGDKINATFLNFATVDYDRAGEIPRCSKPVCIYGDVHAQKTIVMLGDSHTRHWFEAVRYFGEIRGYRIIVAKRGWDFNSVFVEGKPDYIFMVASHTSNSGEPEFAPLRYSEVISAARENDINVIGIRDNPRFNFFQNACLWQNKNNAKKCAVPASDFFAKVSPIDELESAYSNFVGIDLSDLYCDERCYAHYDKGFIYYDKHHFTKTFMLYMRGIFVERLSENICDRELGSNHLCSMGSN